MAYRTGGADCARRLSLLRSPSGPSLRLSSPLIEPGVQVSPQAYTISMGADGSLWGGDYGTSKMVKYDAEGNVQYSWGTHTDYTGGMWGVHQISVDQEGKVYVAEVNNGRVQKFRPWMGANPAFLVGKPVYSAWQ